MKKLTYTFALACSIGILSTIPNINIIQSYATTHSDNDYTIGEAYWDDSDNKLIARWDKPESKTAYKVQLFRNNKSITTKLSTSGESYNFTKNIIDKGSGKYYFTVYAVKAGKDTSLASDTLEIDSDLLYSIRSANRNTSNTNSNNKSSSNNKNNVPSNAVKGTAGGPGVSMNNNASAPAINANNLPIGWNLIDGKYYWNNVGSGLVTNNWLLLDGKWYFFNPDSTMRTGWLEWKGLWYYFADNGEMLTNTTTPDMHRVDANGVWIK